MQSCRNHEGFRFFDPPLQRVIYTPVNWHSNGKWTLWRCSSYMFLQKWEHSIAILVYQRVSRGGHLVSRGFLEDIPTACRCEFCRFRKTQVEQLRAEGNKRGEVSLDGMGWHLKMVFCLGKVRFRRKSTLKGRTWVFTPLKQKVHPDLSVHHWFCWYRFGGRFGNNCNLLFKWVKRERYQPTGHFGIINLDTPELLRS